MCIRDRSVITRDIPANVVAAGVPCRVIRQISGEEKTDYFDILRPEYRDTKSLSLIHIYTLMTAAWLSQVSGRPPMLMAAVSKSHYTAELLKASSRFSVSVLTKDLSCLLYTSRCV